MLFLVMNGVPRVECMYMDMPIKIDQNGHLETDQITGFRVEAIAGSAVLLKINYIKPGEDIHSGCHRFRGTLTPDEAFALASELIYHAQKLQKELTSDAIQ